MPGAFAALWALGLAAGAGAQEQAKAAADRGEQGTEASAPTRDVFDVIRDLRHKPKPPPPGPEDYKKLMIAAAPVVTYGPTSGFGAGVGGNLAFYWGLPDTTRISSVVASATFTTKEQVLVSARMTASSSQNRWRFEGDDRLNWTSQKTYGLGTGTSESDAVDQKYDHFRFYETLYRRIGRNTYLGAGLLYNVHTDVRPADDEASAAWPDSPYLTYSNAFGFDPGSQSSAGFSLNALFDSRDGAINPSRGFHANLSYRMFFEGFLGGTSDWEQVSYDLRTYVRLSRDARHKLAFWLTGDFVTGGTAPYLDLPATGWDTYGRSGRGYPQGRFRGQELVYGEVEYRWTATRNGLLGMVAFANAQTLSNEQSGEALFDAFAPGAGLGLRLLLNKRSQTNLCLDVGWGQEGSRAVYFAIQEAF